MRDLIGSPAIRLVLLIHFFWHMASSALLIIPKWLHGLEYSEGHIGLVMGIAGISSLVFTPFIGRLLDRFDRVRVLRAATALAVPLIVLLPVCALLGSGTLEALRFLQGISFGIAFPTAGTLIADFALPSTRVRALGLFGIVTQVTQAASPGLGEWVAVAWGYDVFFVLAAVSASAACLLTFRLEKTVRRHGRPQHDEPLPEVRAEGAVDPRGALLGLVLATGVTYGAMITFTPVLLLHLGVASIGPFFLAVSLASAFVRLFFGGLGDRMDRDHLIFLSGVVVTIAIAAASAFASTSPGAQSAQYFGIACGLVFGGAAGFFYPVANVRFVELGPASERGKRMAYYSSTYAGGITAGNLVLGYTAQHAGFAAMYGLVALVHAASAAWFATTILRRRSVEPA